MIRMLIVAWHTTGLCERECECVCVVINEVRFWPFVSNKVYCTWHMSDSVCLKWYQIDNLTSNSFTWVNISGESFVFYLRSIYNIVFVPILLISVTFVTLNIGRFHGKMDYAYLSSSSSSFLSSILIKRISIPKHNTAFDIMKRTFLPLLLFRIMLHTDLW